jgi:hypothetical protein
LPGGWIRRSLARLRIPAYRCRACRRRFSKPVSDVGDPASQLEAEAFLTFLHAADNRSFDDVIGDIARDEQQQATALGTVPSPENERFKTVRKLEGVSADGQSRW